MTKVLVNRLRPFLEDLISPMQRSFILGWDTTDKKKERGCDLQINWIWKRHMIELTEIFPRRIVSLIMHGISSSFFGMGRDLILYILPKRGSLFVVYGKTGLHDQEWP